MPVVPIMNVVQPVLDFLPVRTPRAWLEVAVENLPLLLVDHANCEKKAASTALGLMHRYTDNYRLLSKLSRLAREELRHFEQVIAILKKRGIAHGHLTASRYAAGLHAHARKREPGRLVDSLIVGAIIEARSCERFYSLLPYLDSDLAKFYESLLTSESRHFQNYLDMAESAGQDARERLDGFLEIETGLVESRDQQVRFHSGVPA